MCLNFSSFRKVNIPGVGICLRHSMMKPVNSMRNFSPADQDHIMPDLFVTDFVCSLKILKNKSKP